MKLRWLGSVGAVALLAGAALAFGPGLREARIEQLGGTRGGGGPPVHTMGALQQVVAQSSAAPFSPESVPGLVLWYDGVDYTAPTWPAHSGVGPDLTVTVGGAPTDAGDWVQFDGFQDLSANSTPITAAPYTVLAVVEMASPNVSQVVWSIVDKDTFNAQLEGRVAGGSVGDPAILFRRDAATNDSLNTGNGYATNAAQVVAWRSKSATHTQVRLQGNVAAQGEADPATSIVPAALDRFSLGGEIDLNPTLRFTGRVRLVLGYDQAVSDADLLALEGWIDDQGYTSAGDWVLGYQTYFYQGDAGTTAGRYYLARSTDRSNATTTTSLAHNTQWISPHAGTVIAFSWQVEIDAATNPTIRVWGGATSGDTVVDGTKGQASLSQVVVAAGDAIGVEQETVTNTIGDSAFWVLLETAKPSLGTYSLCWTGSPTAGNHYSVGNNPSAGTNGVLPDGAYVAPIAGTATAFTFTSASGDATTDYALVVNGTVTDTFSNVGATGRVTFSRSVAAGDEVAVEFDGGTAPGATSVCVLIETSVSGYVIRYHGNSCLAGNTYRYDAAANTGGLGPTTGTVTITLPVSGTLDKLAYNVATTTTTTDYKTHKDGVASAAVTRTSGTSTGILELNEPVDAADEIELERDAGTETDASNFLIWVSVP